MRHGERWTTTGGALVLVVHAGGAPSGTEPERKAKIPGFIVIICVFVVVLGVAMMVGSGASILDGDLSSGAGRRSGWITPPIAFILGLALALSPVAIIRQERRSPRSPRSETRSLLSLQPEGVIIQEGPWAGTYPWSKLSASVLAHVPPTGRIAVQHYLDHPEHRSELGTPAAQQRTESMT